MIARTESNTATNFALWKGMKQSGVVRRRQWIAINDDRTRDTHSSLHGQTRSIHRHFTLGNGLHALYPGAFGVAKEDINCRCATVPIVDEPKTTEELDAAWKQYDERLSETERLVERVVRSAFRAQEEAFLAAFEERFGQVSGRTVPPVASQSQRIISTSSYVSSH